MNYRHIFHAGSFTDVMKHAVVALILDRLRAKETPFGVLDTHAGIGRYDLTSQQAGRTGEYLGGIARVMAAAGQASAGTGALSGRCPGAESRPRQAALVSRIAAAGETIDAAAGPAASGRTSSGGRGDAAAGVRARPQYQCPAHGRLSCHQGASAAERAARHGADRSALRSHGRVRADDRRRW